MKKYCDMAEIDEIDDETTDDEEDCFSPSN